jgi:hypothetical protein
VPTCSGRDWSPFGSDELRVEISFLWSFRAGKSYGIALRNAGIHEARGTLRMAAKDYAERGYATNYGSLHHQVWLSTNLVSIGGTQYHCFLTTTNGKFLDEGALAMTSNQVFIWIDRKRPPKVVGTNYRAPFFPPRF